MLSFQKISSGKIISETEHSRLFLQYPSLLEGWRRRLMLLCHPSGDRLQNMIEARNWREKNATKVFHFKKISSGGIISETEHSKSSLQYPFLVDGWKRRLMLLYHPSGDRLQKVIEARNWRETMLRKGCHFKKSLPEELYWKLEIDCKT